MATESTKSVTEIVDGILASNKDFAVKDREEIRNQIVALLNNPAYATNRYNDPRAASIAAHRIYNIFWDETSSEDAYHLTSDLFFALDRDEELSWIGVL